MGTSNRRDDFLDGVKRALCDRVGALCSRPDCRAFTKGPKADTTKAKSIGKAAHIRAAAAGGPRYDPEQTPEQRRAYENGIWLCANHADEIDADPSRFSAELLLRWRQEAEDFADSLVGKSSAAVTGAGRGTIAIGPHVLAFGRVLRTAGNTWTVALDQFLIGDTAALRHFSDSFSGLPAEDCFACFEAEGSGRMLVDPPTIDQTAGVVLELHVAAPLPRAKANELFDARKRGTDIAINLSGDEPSLDLGREVSGEETVAQSLMAVLSTCKGGWGIDADGGSRVAELHRKLGPQYLPAIIALETIRIATVPFEDQLLQRTYTTFDFIERVRSVRVLAAASGEHVKVSLGLDVYGIGPTEYTIPISLSTLHLDPPPSDELLQRMVDGLARRFQ
jgi:hypothetical protein